MKKNVFLLIFLFISGTLFANTSEKKVIFTTEEHAWLKKNPIINIAAMEYWETNVEKKNAHIEYINLLKKYGGLNITLVSYPSWKNGYESSIKGKDVFGILNLSWSAQREIEHFYYLPPYTFLPTYLIVQDDNLEIKRLKDLQNKTVGVQAKDINKEYLENLRYNILVEDKFNAHEELYRSLFRNEFDIEAIVTYTLNNKLLKEYKLKVAKEFYNKYGEVHLGINKNHKELYSILNKIYITIPKREFKKIQTKTFKANRLNLTTKEQSWIDKKIPIKYAFDPDWSPFEWSGDSGKHTGIIPDIMNTISKRSGLIFEPIQALNWKEALELSRKQHIDMLPALNENEEQKEFMNFTKNILYKTPYVFTVHQDDSNDYFDTFDSLDGYERIAVIEGSSIQKIIDEKFPKINLVLLQSTLEGFEKLENRDIDIYILNATTSRYYINHKGFKNLKIATRTEFDLELRTAIRNDWPPEVISILDKSISSISQRELKDTYLKWTKGTVKKENDKSFFIQIMIGIILTLIIIIILRKKFKNYFIENK